MKFAESLNAEVNGFYKREMDVITDDEFVLIKVKQYTEQIKQLCVNAARGGQRGLRGFFVPERKDCNYEVTYDGPLMFDKPRNLIYKRPIKSMDRCGRACLAGGAYDLERANIYLFDGLEYGKPVACAGRMTDGTMNALVEKVRVGIINNLSCEGFGKLEIEHLRGPRYALKKHLLMELVSVVGSSNYLYVDIAW